MSDTASLDLQGAWQAFQKALDAGLFSDRLKKNVASANRRIGRQFQATARRRIRQGKYAANSPLTIALKGSSRPLVNGGQLFQGLSYDVPDYTMVRVGVFRRGSGQEVVDIGHAVHEGYSFEPTDAQRAAVFAQLAEEERDSLSLGEPAKTTWTVPPRPYITDVLEDQGFQKFAGQQWIDAVRVTFLGGG